MLRITGLIHTHDDGQRLGRTLESLRPCDHLLVVDHGSKDDTVRVAREYGADVLHGDSCSRSQVLLAAGSDWVLSVLPTEALTEGLEASLYEWKLGDPSPGQAFNVEIREQRHGDWSRLGVSTRLVNRTVEKWRGELPRPRKDAALLDGVLLRFLSP